MSDLAYGPVVVIDGPYVGRVGLYDDDDNKNRCVVYLTGYCGVSEKKMPEGHLMNISGEVARWIKRNTSRIKELSALEKD